MILNLNYKKFGFIKIKIINVKKVVSFTLTYLDNIT